jgi:chloramphenicol-sensitive protein RarD
MSLETGMLFIPAILYLNFAPGSSEVSYLFDGGTITWLLIVSGVATAFPLIWFSECAQRVPLSMLGVLQYLAPTLQFMIGLLVFHEPFDSTRLLGFVIIWFALALYSIEGFLFNRRKPRASNTQ